MRAHLESFRALDLGDHGVDSLAELRAIRLVVEAGAPEPLVNHPVTTPSGDKRLDLYFLFAGVVVEVDGWDGHGTRTAFEKDRLRDAEVLALGLITTRYSVTRLEAEPEACAAEILDLVLTRMRERAIREAAG